MKVNNLPQTYKTLPSAKTFVYHFLGFHQILLTSGKLCIPELCLTAKPAVSSVKVGKNFYMQHVFLSHVSPLMKI